MIPVPAMHLEHFKKVATIQEMDVECYKGSDNNREKFHTQLFEKEFKISKKFLKTLLKDYIVLTR